MDGYEKFVVAIDLLKAQLRSVYIDWEYDVDTCLYQVLFEPNDEILGRKLYFRVWIPKSAVSELSLNDIRLSLIDQYYRWNKRCHRILRKYKKHKMKELRRKNKCKK